MQTTVDEPSQRQQPGSAAVPASGVLILLVLAAAMALTALVLAWLAFDRAGRADDAVDRLPGTIDEVLAAATPEPADASRAYGRIAASFVIVQVERADPDANDERADRGLGSGFIVNASGDIVTAHHVVADGDRITVRFGDGTESSATISSTDPVRDIAVLRPQRVPDPVVPAVLSSVATLQVGEPVFVVGNPLGLTASISAGIVSGLERTVPIANGEQLGGLIQFDAAVNPGTSGGPLVNGDGQVVGIVTALANATDQSFFTGVAFAVPVSVAADVAGSPDQ